MVFIKIYPNTKKVKYIHYYPFHKEYGLEKTEKELSKEGILLDSIPEEPEPAEGKYYDMYYNEENNQIYYKEETIVNIPYEEE